MPIKDYLRGILLHYFIKQIAAEAQRILVESFSDHAVSEHAGFEIDDSKIAI